MNRSKPGVRIETRTRGRAAAVAVVAAAFIVVGLFGASGCRRGAEPGGSPGSGSGSEHAVAVSVISVAEQETTMFESVVGTVRSKTTAQIAARVGGRVTAVEVRPGQMVDRGDLLARLDDREIAAKLVQARAVLDQVQADRARYAKLLADQAVTQAEFDAVEARFTIAAAAVTEAETQLDHTRIVAPFDGVVTRRLVDPGDLANPGIPLIALEDPVALRFEADIPEVHFERVTMGATFSVVFGSEPSVVTRDGVVVEIAPDSNPVTRTFLVKLELPGATGLRPGQFGRVRIPIAMADVIRVPESAVRIRGQLELVFVVEQDSARLVLVRTGRRTGGEVEILAGVREGDRVVTDPPARLKDGQRVVVGSGGSDR